MSAPTLPRKCRHGERVYWRSFWTDDTGRRRGRSFGAAGPGAVSESEARARFDAWLRDRSSRPEAAGRRTVRVAASEYLRHVEGFYRGPTGDQTGHVRKVGAAVGDFSKSFRSTLTVRLGLSQFERQRAAWIGRGLARSTVNAYAAELRRFGRWLVVHDWADPSLSERWRAVPALAPGRAGVVEAPPTPVATRENVEAVARVSDTQTAAMVRLQWATAMRPGELLSMAPAHVDMAGEPWVYRPPAWKLGHRGFKRAVQLGPVARSILALARDVFEGLPLTNEKRRRPVFAGVTPNAYRLRLRFASARCRVSPTVTPYSIRRGSLTAIEQRFGRLVAASVAGHKSAATTDAYVRQAEENERRARGAVEEIG